MGIAHRVESGEGLEAVGSVGKTQARCGLVAVESAAKRRSSMCAPKSAEASGQSGGETASEMGPRDPDGRFGSHAQA